MSNERLIREVRGHLPRAVVERLANALDVDAPEELPDPFGYHVAEAYNQAKLWLAWRVCRRFGHRPEGGVYEAMFCDRCWRTL